MNADELTAVLEDKGLSRVAATHVVEQLLESSSDSGPSTDFKAVFRTLNGKHQVALRDEDIDLVKVCAELCSTFLAAASIGHFAPAAIAALVILLYRFRTRSVDITPLQGLVLKAIRSPRALTSAQIAQELGIDGVNDQVVSQELAWLADAPRRDGLRLKLVAADANGRWTAQGV